MDEIREFPKKDWLLFVPMQRRDSVKVHDESLLNLQENGTKIHINMTVQ